ncbi:TPA: hypothetical protein ACGNG1_001675 [Streptococcus agalactiae]
MTKVAEQLNQLRVKHQLSQDALAEQLFISRQAISKWGKWRYNTRFG